MNATNQSAATTLPADHPLRVHGVKAIICSETPRGYCYSIIYNNGDGTVLRAHSTRRYENAYFYDDKGTRNNAKPGVLAGYFTWGKSPESWGGKVRTPTATYRIQDEFPR